MSIATVAWFVDNAASRTEDTTGALEDAIVSEPASIADTLVPGLDQLLCLKPFGQAVT